MLTGRLPFEQPRNAESEFPILAAHIHKQPTPPSVWEPGIPVALEAAILKALAKQPENRFDSCQEFQAAIAPFALAPTRIVSVSPEMAARQAAGSAVVPKPPPTQPEVRPPPKGLPPLPPRPQFKAPPPRQGMTLVGTERLMAAALLLIIIVMAWGLWRRVNSVTSETPPQEEINAPANPQAPSPDQNMSSPSANVEAPSLAPVAGGPSGNPSSPRSATAQIVVQTSPNAQVYLDESSKGRANGLGRLVINRLDVGDHILRVSLAGKKDYEERVVVAAGQQALFDVTLADDDRPLPPPPVEMPRRPVPTPEPATVEPGPASPQVDTRQHTVRAAQFLRNKQYAEAASEYRAAIQLDPQNADLHVSLGMTLGQQGDWDGQVAEDREAVRLDPNNDRAHLSLGMALMRKRDREGAMAEYREAIRLNPNNEGAHVSLAILCSQMGDWDGAIAEYTTVVRMHPNNYGAHYSLGMAYEHKGDRQAALQEYRTACDLNPNIPVYQQAYQRLLQQGYR
jgi:Tfp pilus assembly protein PilF